MRFDCKHEEPSFEVSGEGNTEENPSQLPILRWQIRSLIFLVRIAEPVSAIGF
ncbi:hypothetical protein NIES2104_05180 [Leptolyngbya sp. NIES-2104]|nr:hypothetical protein NIES2104_05180 [Leptolyngbya sp. NIES-2104]